MKQASLKLKTYNNKLINNTTSKKNELNYTYINK